MRKIDKIELLIQVSRLYYEMDLSQQMIAEKLQISRPYVSKLISEAKTSGIVEIKIHNPDEKETPIEKKVREKFRLQKVYIKSGSHNNIESLALSTVRYLNNIISDNDIIGVVWGNTLFECSKRAIHRDDIQNITVVQLCGGISRVERNIFASEIPKNFAAAYGGTPYILPLPAMVDSEDVKNAIIKDKNIASVVEMGKRANIALITVGSFGPGNAVAKAGYLTSEEVDELSAKGAVGDICSRIIDINGNIIDPVLDRRTIAIELADLKKIENTIAIVAGVERAKCLCGTLRGGYCNILITDEDTASELLRICGD